MGSPIHFIRPDFLLSYWIYAWFFTFYLGQEVSPFIKKYANPSLVFWIALIENMATFFTLLVYNAKWSILVKYAIMIFIVKGVPLYLLRPYDIHVYRDILIICCVLIIYLGYLWINNTNAIEIYQKTFEYVLTGDDRTPMFAFFKKISTFTSIWIV